MTKHDKAKTKKLGVRREVDKDNPGIVWESRPTHNPPDKRLPERPADYIHTTGLRAKASDREVWAQAAYKRGLAIEQILIGTGFTVENLFACLHIPREGNEKLYEYLIELKNKHNSI